MAIFVCRVCNKTKTTQCYPAPATLVCGDCSSKHLNARIKEKEELEANKLIEEVEQWECRIRACREEADKLLTIASELESIARNMQNLTTQYPIITLRNKIPLDSTD